MQVPVHDVESVRVPGVVPGHVPPALAAVRVGEPVADPRQGPVNPHLEPDSLLSLLYNLIMYFVTLLDISHLQKVSVSAPVSSITRCTTAIVSRASWIVNTCHYVLCVKIHEEG